MPASASGPGGGSDSPTSDERGAHRRRVGIALAGVDAAGALDDRRERTELRRRGDRPLRARGEHAERRVGGERDLAR